MRTALLSALDVTDDGMLRAELELAGRTILEGQVAVALELGCERFVCIGSLGDELSEPLKRLSETEDARFHEIESNLELVSLIHADDELVIMLDGLAVDRSLLLELVAKEDRPRSGIATLPSDHELSMKYPNAFERIDRDRHWAGVAFVKADRLHQLADFPPDSHAVSMLLRMALQARAPCYDIGSDIETGAFWTLANDHQQLAHCEARLIKAQSERVSVLAPVRAMAAWCTRTVSQFNRGHTPEILGGVTGSLYLAGATLAYLDRPVIGLTLGGLGAFAANLSEYGGKLRTRILGVSTHLRLSFILYWSTILALFVTTLLGLDLGLESLATGGFAALALGLAMQQGRREAGNAILFWKDTGLHFGLFALAASFNHLVEAVALFGLAALGSLMLRERQN